MTTKFPYPLLDAPVTWQFTGTRVAGTEVPEAALALLEQLAKAGVAGKKEGDKLSEQDKTRLLDYLRKQHGGQERVDPGADRRPGQAGELDQLGPGARPAVAHELQQVAGASGSGDAGEGARAVHGGSEAHGTSCSTSDRWFTT